MTVKEPRTYPPMNLKEEARLLRTGLDLGEWVSSRMIAGYWGIPIGRIRQAVFRGSLPQSVKAGNQNFYPREFVLTSWVPKEFEVEIKKETLRALGLPNGIQPAELTKKARTQATYLKALSDRVSIEEWKSIIQRAIKDALLGDAKARAWLSSYLIGTPIQRIAASLMVTEERFTKAERLSAIELMREGLIGDSTILEAVIPDSGEADRSPPEGESTVDATSE